MQKTACEVSEYGCSSDVVSSDLNGGLRYGGQQDPIHSTIKNTLQTHKRTAFIKITTHEMHFANMLQIQKALSSKLLHLSYILQT